MSQTDSPSRQVHLDQLGPLAQKIVATMAAAGIPDNDRVDVLTAHVGACCQRCGSTLSALDLLRLGLSSQPESIGDDRLARVLRGYCADEACKSYYYSFTFQDHPAITWPSVGTTAAPTPGKAQLDPAVQARIDQERAERWQRRRRTAMRVMAGLVLLAILLLARRWQAGGSIPVLREPRQFTAAPQPEPKAMVAATPATAPSTVASTAPLASVSEAAAAVLPRKAARDPEMPDPSAFKPDPADMKKK